MKGTNSNHGSCRRARLLLLAYASAPGRGSESSVGWNRAVQAGRFADTWVICEGRECESAVRRHIAENGPVPGVRFVFVPLTKLQVALMKLPGCYYLGYHLWHRSAFGVARRLHAEHNFDLAHQVNFVGYREPGFLWRLPIPFVWGPIGGTQNFPYRFLPMFGLRHIAWEAARNLLNRVQLRTSFRVRRAARKASALLAANSTNQCDMTRACGVPVTRMLEIGVSQIDRRLSDNCPIDGRLRILWSGFIEPHKALPLLIEALAHLPADVRWDLRVLGDGSLYLPCRRRARKLGIDDRIDWLGWRPHSEALEQYAQADVFAFTSLRDTTGTVVLEALSHGVPVICFDHQGVADVITSECGIKIRVTSPSQAIRDLAGALQQLGRDPERRCRLSEGARRRAAEYLWSRQGEQMAAVYRQVLTAAGSDAVVREQFDFPISAKLDEAEVCA